MSTGPLIVAPNDVVSPLSRRRDTAVTTAVTLSTTLPSGRGTAHVVHGRCVIQRPFGNGEADYTLKRNVDWRPGPGERGSGADIGRWLVSGPNAESGELGDSADAGLVLPYRLELGWPEVD